MHGRRDCASSAAITARTSRAATPLARTVCNQTDLLRFLDRFSAAALRRLAGAAFFDATFFIFAFLISGGLGGWIGSYLESPLGRRI